VTKCPDSLKPIDQKKVYEELKISPKQNLYFSKLYYGELTPVFSDNAEKVSLTPDNKVFAIAGIANPKPFFSHLESKYVVNETIALPDHFHFTEKKIRAIFDSFSQIKTEKKIIITTEKDASRLRGFSNLPIEIKKFFYYIPIEIEFLDHLEEDFNKKIKAYVRKD
jgi:tetraacyldisaccharide 4'-kinase